MRDEIHQPIEVYPAYTWMCECGAEHYGDCELHEFSPEEQAEVVETFKFWPRTGDWLTYPEVVQCRSCGEWYRTC